MMQVDDLSLVPPIPFLVSEGKAYYPNSFFNDRKQCVLG